MSERCKTCQGFLPGQLPYGHSCGCDANPPVLARVSPETARRIIDGDDANPPHENGTNTKDVSPEKDTNPVAPSSDDDSYVRPPAKQSVQFVPASEVERLKYEMDQFIQAYAPDFFDEPDGFVPKLDMNSAALVRRTLKLLLNPPESK